MVASHRSCDTYASGYPWSMLPACLLALVAGYADTVGYLRYDAFAGLMTGNTILLGIDVANGRAPSAAFHGGIIAVFLAGVIASRVLLQLRHAAWLALTVAAILLVVCSFIGRFWAAMVARFRNGNAELRRQPFQWRGAQHRVHYRQFAKAR
jgi:uncharacterized membrane protein YoaK (UPF0700 family)